jgi:hypothetical protein
MPEVPTCVGTYEYGNTVCDGINDPNASYYDQVHCAWRDRCVGLKMFCQEFNHTPSAVVAAQSFVNLVELCENQVTKHNISGGVPGGRDEPKELSTEKNENVVETNSSAFKKEGTRKVSSTKANSARKKPSTRKKKTKNSKVKIDEYTLSLGDHFTAEMKSLFPERRFSSKKKVIVEPGVFYTLDKTKTNLYTTWYCTSERGRDYFIARLYYKPKFQKVNIALPVTIDKLEEFLGTITYKKLNLSERNLGKFKCVANRLDLNGVSLCAEVIKKLIAANIVMVYPC